MVDNAVEKTFLYLLGLSLLLHCAIFAVIAYLPQEKPSLKQEPYMVDLRDFPDLPPPAPRKEEQKRLSDRQRRVEREMVRKGPQELDRPTPPPQPKPPTPQPSPPGPREPVARKPSGPYSAKPMKPAPGDLPTTEPPAGQDFFKPDRKRTDVARLYPSARSMSQLEQSYRKRFEADVAQGDTNFLNTDDIQFGSFLRRFENAVYGVWRYPQEAARLGIEGVTPVRITFNRKGEVESVQILESSGSRILDQEVVRTLHSLGPIGSFPRNYDKEQFHLIAFFQYNISRGGMTGRLR